MAASSTESTVEEAALAWVEALGYAVPHGLLMAPYGVLIGIDARFVARVAE